MLAKPPPPSSSKRGEMENGGRSRVRRRKKMKEVRGVGVPSGFEEGRRKERKGKLRFCP